MTLEELWSKRTNIIYKLTPYAKFIVDYLDYDLDPKSFPFTITAFSNPMGIVGAKGDVSIKVPKSIKNKSIEFYQMVPKGVLLSRLKIDPKSVLKSGLNAIDFAVEDSNTFKPEIIFLFDCILRKIFLMDKNRTIQFISILKKKYPDAKIIGFNSMGEFVFNKKSGSISNVATISVGVISDELTAE